MNLPKLFGKFMYTFLWNEDILPVIHKCPRQFRQSDWAKRNHVGGVLADGKDMAYQNQNRAYLPAVRQLFCATRISTNQRVMKIGITRQTHVLWKWFVCPRICPFIFGFIQQIYIYIFLLKTKTVPIARDHAQNRSLTCRKHCPATCYSLNMLSCS